MRLPILLATGSAALISAVNFVAASAALSVGGLRPMLVIAAFVAVGFAVQSAGWDPSALPMALLLTALPLVGMIASSPAPWLIAVTAAALLVAGELNSLSWELRDFGEVSAMAERRIRSIGQLGVFGLGAALGVGMVASVPLISGLPGLVVGACALVVLGRLLGAGR